MNAISPPRHVRDGGGGWQPVGVVGDGVVRRIGLQAILFHLSRATEGDDRDALAGFREANAIRSQLGLTWKQAFAGGAEGGP